MLSPKLSLHNPFLPMIMGEGGTMSLNHLNISHLWLKETIRCTGEKILKQETKFLGTALLPILWLWTNHFTSLGLNSSSVK